MAKPKFYFRRFDDELCFTEKYHLENMKDEGIKELQVFEAKPFWDEQYFFCRAVNECGEKGNCGKECEDYEPCNGKNGRCRHMGKFYEPGNAVTLIVK
jgi:hypothetical protein